MASETEHSAVGTDRVREPHDPGVPRSRGGHAQRTAKTLPVIQEPIQPGSSDGDPGSAEARGRAETEKETAEERKLAERLSHIQRKILVLSGKGGVGKSTIAANLAVSLALKKKRVGLLDIDIHGPSIPKMLGLEEQQIAGSDDGMLPVPVNKNLAVMSIGFMLPGNGSPVIWRGPLKFGVIRQFLMDVAWGSLDYLVVDSPPGTGDEPLSVAQLIGSGAEAVIVTTPQDVAVTDVRRCVTFCDKLSVPVVGIVENMSSYVCPKCGDRANLFGAGGGKLLAEEMDVPFLGEVPIDPDILISGDIGRPFTAEYAVSPGALAFAGVVLAILEPKHAMAQ